MAVLDERISLRGYPTSSRPMTQLKITDDLEALLQVLPLDIRKAVEKADDSENLL